ncbi:hypothetical protein Tco_1528971 [Tanacetum coccineum]
MLALQVEEGEVPIPSVVSSSHQKTQTPRQALIKVTELPQTSEPIPNVPDEAVYKEWDDKVERATTTAISLDAEQASGNINMTQSTTIPNVPLPQGIDAGGSPRCQAAMGGFIALTRSERVIEKRMARSGIGLEDFQIWVLHSAPITTTGESVSTVTTAEPSTPPTTTTAIEDEDLTIAQTFMTMKSKKSKVKGVTMQEPSCWDSEASTS